MPTLLLLRHAKSSWDDISLRDFDRPLGPRGRKAAPVMGDVIAKAGLSPDLVLCSPAARARETLDLVLAKLKRAPEVRYIDRVYSGAAPDLRREIRGQAGDVPVVMMVGHNPTLQSLAMALAGSGNAAEMEALERKFPTAALAAIDFDFKYWRDIAAGGGTLRFFKTPAQALGQSGA